MLQLITPIRTTLRLAIVLIATSATCMAAQPNVVLIISDDHAWNDYGFMDHPTIETPHLDQLARESLTYTRGYVSSPLCRPSLASIVSGLPTHQHGITGNDIRITAKDARGRSINGMRSRVHPDWAPKHEQIYAAFEKVPNVARLLNDAGYLALQTGKWWESNPERFGFTHAMTHGDPQRGGRHGDEGLKVSRDGIGQVKSFLDTAAREDKPFFIWHAPFLPHTPHNPPQRLHDKYLAKEPNKFVSRYMAMVEWFDETCGELLAEIKTRGLDENTIVIYVADNGWIQDPKSAKFAPLSKQDSHDGGIRTPIMVRWLGQVDAKMDHSTIVASTDIAPTILKSCGIEVPASMQGIDLRDTPALQQRNVAYGCDGNHDIFDLQDRTSNIETRFIIHGDWKLLIHHPNPELFRAYNGVYTGREDNREGRPELYNLTADPFEKENLAESNPQQLATLQKMLDDWWQGPAK